MGINSKDYTLKNMSVNPILTHFTLEHTGFPSPGHTYPFNTGLHASTVMKSKISVGYAWPLHTNCLGA
jgi:hypothetical protein